MNDTLPRIGFGTWKLKNDPDTTFIVEEAIRAGYALIDTASSYQNEQAIGNAIARCDRSKIIVSGKLWNDDREDVAEACDRTIRNLKCEYLDVYLMHWPASKAVHDDWEKINLSVWRQMEELVYSGKVRYIGVSNFKVNQLESLMASCRIRPFVNQIEHHPGFNQQDIVEYCKTNNIIVQAWSPFRSGRSLKKKEVISVAGKYGRTPAQIILKWCIQDGIIPIVKSTSPDRMRSNLDLDFELSEEDMVFMNSLPYLGSSGLDSETLTLFG
jgi:diketogulonate reductase-like aldo/keto reductase